MKPTEKGRFFCAKKRVDWERRDIFGRGRIKCGMDVKEASGERFEARELTTFKGGGWATAFMPENEEEFAEIVRKLQSEGRDPFVMGGGSNVIIADGEIDTPIVCTRKMNALRFEGDVAAFEAGATVAKLLREARRRGLGGAEFLEGVPATLGGALRMNAGAFGEQIADLAVYARILTDKGGNLQVEEIKPNFEYRKGPSGIILGGAVKLRKMSEEESLERRERFLKFRAAKQPRKPSCGSVFKNVATSEDRAREAGLAAAAKMCAGGICVLPAGALIEACGLKGRKQGGARISQLHANFIVNEGGATAGDFLALARLAEEMVYEKFGLRLEREFVLLE